jgi:protein-disulfide isomerase
VHQNRLVLLAGAVIAAAVVAGVLIAVSSNGGSGSTTTTAATETSPSVTGLLTGIPQHGVTLGDPKAPATLLVFEDPQCPFCQEWALGTLPQVLTDYVRTGRVKLVYHGIEVIGPNSVPGLRAIYAAGKQNKLWNFTEALYRQQGSENSGWITDSLLAGVASSVGLSGKTVLTAAASAPVTADLRAAAQEATTLGVNGTPTFILQRPPGLPRALQLSALDTASFEAALEQALS